MTMTDVLNEIDNFERIRRKENSNLILNVFAICTAVLCDGTLNIIKCPGNIVNVPMNIERN